MWYTGLIKGLSSSTTKLSRRKLSKYRNDYVFQNEFIRNTLDAMHRYRIEELPETVSERIVLQSLLWTGSVFFFEKNGAVLALPGMPDGSGVNVYEDFAGAYVYGANGYNEHIQVYLPGSDKSKFLLETIHGDGTTDAKGVMVRENELVFPFINQTYYYAERQMDTLRKIEVAAKNAACPYWIVAKQSVVNTVNETMKQRDDNMDFIISSGVFDPKDISLMPFDISADSIKVMTSTYDWYRSQYKVLCGQQANLNADKKGENINSAEINVDQQYVASQYNNVIQSIQAGLDTANELFSLSMRVVPAASVAVQGQPAIEQNSEVQDNGRLQNVQ